MGKRKDTQKKTTILRIPKPLHDRLLRIKTERTIKTGKPVSVNSLIVEAVEKSLTTAAA